ncbi:pseudaminic acid synthase [Candidatus Uhrbacteria bacterium]|nr:pseudaminic acid synthase [Candidatus Uhrbacteria bacterium]
MSTSPHFSIQSPRGIRHIGVGHPVFIVAEMSCNHLQDINRAYRIIDAMVDAGVDAVKVQTVSPETLTMDCDNEYFQVNVNSIWKGQSLFELYKKVYMPWEWQPILKRYAEEKGVIFFSTPVDPSGVDFLETIDVPLYKIASFEIGYIDLLRRIAQTNKPVIFSRGLSSLEDIELALSTLRENGCSDIALLHCVSSYPATPAQMNLRTIPDIASRFNVVTGLSDHTADTRVVCTAVALGASIFEKHVTLSRADGGPDAAFSLEPQEVKELVNAIRSTEQVLGVPTYIATSDEKENAVFRRSLFVTEDIKRGERFTRSNIRCIRPAHGLHPKYFDFIFEKKATKDLQRGTPLNWESVEGGTPHE